MNTVIRVCCCECYYGVQLQEYSTTFPSELCIQYWEIKFDLKNLTNRHSLKSRLSLTSPILLDFRLLPCSECYILSLGWFPDVWILCADILENPEYPNSLILFILPAYTTCEDGTKCSERSALKILTLGESPTRKNTTSLHLLTSCIHIIFCVAW